MLSIETLFRILVHILVYSIAFLILAMKLINIVVENMGKLFETCVDYLITMVRFINRIVPV